jgi:ankyrin repeat protein
MPTHCLTAESRAALKDELRLAIDAKDLPACTELLDAGADPNATLGTVGSLLTYTIESSFTEGAILLLDRGAYVEAPNAARRSPLLSAARMGNVRIGEELVQRGAEIENHSADPYGELGATALHEAARKARVEFARFLINQGANIDTRDVSGHSALHRAVAGDGDSDAPLAFVQLLIAAGASLDGTPPSPSAGYLTPFQWALANAHPRVMSHLLDHHEHLLEKPTLDGRAWASIVSKANLPLVMSVLAGKAARSIDAGLGAGLGSLNEASHSKGAVPL